MKKSLLLAFAAGLFALNAQAADIKPYVSAKAGFLGIRAKAEIIRPIREKQTLNDTVFGYNLAAGAGIKMEEGILRIELEYAQNGNAEKTILGEKEKFKSYAFFVNAYFDFETNSAFRPYVGAGIGGSRVKFGDKSKNDAAYNYSAGINYLLNDNVALDLGYRFSNYADFEEKELLIKTEYTAYANEIMFGVRFSF